MQALVTGCAGFIGSRLTETLLAQGVAVRVLPRYYQLGTQLTK